MAAANAGGQGVTLTQAPYALRVDERGRTVGEVLRSIATHYASGTPGGVRMDPESALIWSPAHFTWMDTNYPAATPREGYPIEIQALWIRLLRQLERLHLPPAGEPWGQLAARAERSTQQRFWLESKGYYADVLAATPGQPASAADVDDALRSNCVFAVSLGVASGERARRCLDAVRRHLVVVAHINESRRSFKRFRNITLFRTTFLKDKTIVSMKKCHEHS